MRLRPVSDTDAPETVQVVFQDAKALFEMSAVPLMLRFIANAPPYLFYLWESMQFDLQSPEFRGLSGKLISFSMSSVSIIYTPSDYAAGFSQAINQEQKRELEILIQKLLTLNSMFFLFALDLREDLKTAFTQSQETGRLPDGSGIFTNQESRGEKRDTRSVTMSRMLAPLFGETLPSLPNVETFFQVTESEMGRVGKTESYLKTRVELERIGLLYLSLVPRRMISNYKVFMELIEDKYVAYDLLYLLTHVFPSEFPRLLLTTALMQKLLQGEAGLATR